MSDAADHREFRDDGGDYCTRPEVRIGLMSPAQQQVLSRNTARALGAATEMVRRWHTGNSLKPDEDYGRSFAGAPGIPMKDMPK